MVIGVLGGARMDLRRCSRGAGRLPGMRCPRTLWAARPWRVRRSGRLLELELQGLGEQQAHPLRVEPGGGAGQGRAVHQARRHRLPDNLPTLRDRPRKSIRAPPSTPIPSLTPVSNGPGKASTGPQKHLGPRMTALCQGHASGLSRVRVRRLGYSACGKIAADYFSPWMSVRSQEPETPEVLPPDAVSPTPVRLGRSDDQALPKKSRNRDSKLL